MANLTSLANVKAYLSIGDSTRDGILNLLIPAASRAIEKACDRTFNEATYADDRYSGNWQRTLQLRNYPVITFTGIWDDSARVFASSSLIDSVNYSVDNETGQVELDGLIFSKGVRNIKVSYTAGYTTIPADLELIAIKLVSFLYNKRFSDGASSESIGEGSVTYEASIPKDIQDSLVPWVKQVESE